MVLTEKKYTLARYTGVSDRVSSLRVFNSQQYYPEAGIIAQMAWYFIEGYHYRSKEYPFGSRANSFKKLCSSFRRGKNLFFIKK